MDKSDNDKQEGDRYTMFGSGQLSKPVWVRYFGFQTNSVNQRLLEYNVRAIFISIPIVLFVLLVL
jgi:hypothetical protein